MEQWSSGDYGRIHLANLRASEIAANVFGERGCKCERILSKDQKHSKQILKYPQQDLSSSQVMTTTKTGLVLHIAPFLGAKGRLPSLGTLSQGFVLQT
jgi:hypothetical protein